MSTFTIIHHTAPHIPFKPAEEWNAAKAQLSGTVHCDFPGWCQVSGGCCICVSCGACMHGAARAAVVVKLRQVEAVK